MEKDFNRELYDIAFIFACIVFVIALFINEIDKNKLEKELSNISTKNELMIDRNNKLVNYIANVELENENLKDEINEIYDNEILLKELHRNKW